MCITIKPSAMPRYLPMWISELLPSRKGTRWVFLYTYPNSSTPAHKPQKSLNLSFWVTAVVFLHGDWCDICVDRKPPTISSRLGTRPSVNDPGEEEHSRIRWELAAWKRDMSLNCRACLSIAFCSELLQPTVLLWASPVPQNCTNSVLSLN